MSDDGPAREPTDDGPVSASDDADATSPRNATGDDGSESPSESTDRDDWGRIPVPDAEERQARAKEFSGTSDYPGSGSGPTASSTGADEPDEDAYRPEPSDRVIESGSPSLENAIFVLLGAIGMILIMMRLGSILAV